VAGDDKRSVVRAKGLFELLDGLEVGWFVGSSSRSRLT